MRAAQLYRQSQPATRTGYCRNYSYCRPTAAPPLRMLYSSARRLYQYDQHRSRGTYALEVWSVGRCQLTWLASASVGRGVVASEVLIYLLPRLWRGFALRAYLERLHTQALEYGRVEVVVEGVTTCSSTRADGLTS